MKKDEIFGLMQREIEPISDIEFEHLIKSGVNCSSCNKSLTKEEILMHKYVDIIEASDMMCQADWMKILYTSPIIP